MSVKRSVARKFPRQSRSKATVDALVIATVRVVGEDGYARASTNRIADVAGVSIGSLYQYFPNKESLVGQAIEDRLAQMEEVVTGAFSALEGLAVRDAAPRLTEVILASHAKDIPFQAQFHDLLATVGMTDSYLAYRRRVTDLARLYLEAHRDEVGRDTGTASVMTADLFDAMMHSAIQHFPERLTDPAFIDEVATVLIDYLRVPRSTGHAARPP